MAEMKQDMYGAIGRLGNKTGYQRLGKKMARTYHQTEEPQGTIGLSSAILMPSV